MESGENKQENNIRLDAKSRVFFLVLVLLIAGAVAATWWRYVIERDYIIQAQTDCDPTTENCFIWKCDPNSLEEGEKCTGNPDEDIWYYKIIRRNAKNIPFCDPKNESCTALVCAENESQCQEELCSAENVPEKESCNVPEQYLLKNPPEDEECASDDEECLTEQESAECPARNATQSVAGGEEGDEECQAQDEKLGCDPEQDDCNKEEQIPQ